MTDEEFNRSIEKYDLNGLYEILDGIDAEKYPQRYEYLNLLLQKHKSSSTEWKNTSNFEHKTVGIIIAIATVILFFVLHVPDESHGFISYVIRNQNQMWLLILLNLVLWILIAIGVWSTKKVKIAIFVLAFIPAFASFNYFLGMTLPYRYTQYFGTESTLTGKILSTSQGNEKSCRDYIEIKIDSISDFQRMCVEHNLWENTKAFRSANFIAKNSAYGVIITNFFEIDINNDAISVDSTMRMNMEMYYSTK